jgi:protein KTI12
VVLAAVKRMLGPRDVVVLDAAAGSYIKGWRYQLWCEAKAVRSACCVVQVGTAVEAARALNERRLERKGGGGGEGEERRGGGDADDGEEMNKGMEDGEEPYEPDVWENLVFRYEEPSGMARWDRPLFTVLWEDAAPPCADIWDAMMGTADAAGTGIGTGAKAAMVVKPHQATLLKPAASEGYLYELDRVTRDVVDTLVQWGRENGGGDAATTGSLVDVSPARPAADAERERESGEHEDGNRSGNSRSSSTARLFVQLPVSSAVSVPALQRLRRQFITMNRLETVRTERIRASFVHYLNDSFEGVGA